MFRLMNIVVKSERKFNKTKKLSVRYLSRSQDFRYKIVNHFLTHSSKYSWHLHSEHKYQQFDLVLELKGLEAKGPFLQFDQS